MIIKIKNNRLKVVVIIIKSNKILTKTKNIKKLSKFQKFIKIKHLKHLIFLNYKANNIFFIKYDFIQYFLNIIKLKSKN